MLIKKHLLIILINIITYQFISAQDVQWASKVLGFSSEGNSKVIASTDKDNKHQYKAEQVVGKPNKLPAYGLSPVAWAPAKKNNATVEWVKVGFDNPMKIKQIGIAENSNPGAISRVLIYDQNNKEHEVYRMPNVRRIGSVARIFSIEYTSDFKVTAVKVELSTAKVEGWNQIDAIAISNSTAPIKAEINLTDKFDLEDKPQNLGTNINSRYQEVAPIISPDGQTIYFTRDEHPMNVANTKNTGKGKYKQDVWFAKKRADGLFEMAQSVGQPINNQYHNSAFSVTPDGNSILLNNVYNTDLKRTPKRGISITRREKNNKWSQPQKIEITNFENTNKYSEFFMSQDGNILLMTIQRDDSRGGKDIHVSFKQGDKWSKPKNLGATINTAANEISPFLASDGKTLYYSTSGLSGYGSNDIFMSKRQDNSWTNWSEPQNLGSKINTPKSDTYFSIPASADFAYYSSSYKAMGGNDIFRISLQDKPDPVALIKGTVYNAKTKEPIAAKIVYSTLEENATVNENTNSNPDDGKYKVVLQLGNKYDLHAEAKGFIAIEDSVSLEGVTEYREITKDLYLMPIEKGAKFKLNNIFFSPGKFILLKESIPALNSLAKTMQENPTMEIRLEGHTERFGKSEKERVKLGYNRVKSVKRYLEGKGINGNRIKLLSRGSKDAKSDKDLQDNDQGSNRRVEVRILKN